MAKPVPLSVYRRGVPKSKAFRGFRDKMPIRFRLYPERKGGLYIVVQVWPSLAQLRAYMTVTYPTKISYRRTLGMCSSFQVIAYPKGKPQRTRPIFAEVNLCVSRLTMRIVTHEMFHVTMAFARRARIDLAACQESWEGVSVTAPEERLCVVHGTLCADFVSRATALGLYEDKLQPVVREAA